MNPTLCALDFLEVTPYQDRAIRTGDVVAFAPPDGRELIAHRVVALRDGRIRTRGDNNASVDSYWLERGHLLGQVTGAWRGSRLRRVAGGPAGTGVAWWARQRKRLDRVLSPVLHPLYDALARSGLLGRFWPRRLAPRVVVFRVEGHPCARLLLGHRTIGHYDNSRQRWQIRRPYRLIVDATVLAAPELAEEGYATPLQRGAAEP
jgi:hypothetical protein